jgi:hypothetical protein
MSEPRGMGTVLALWFLVPALLMKTGMSLMSIFNTRFVSENIDGIPVSAFNEVAQTNYLTAFQLLGLAHLPGITFGFIAAIWLRRFIPLAAGLLLAESFARRFLLGDNPLLWFTEGPKIGINFVLMALLAAALVAAVLDPTRRAPMETKILT